jgi:uncharacterized protein
MFKTALFFVVSLMLAVAASAAANGVVTGSERGTYIQIGKDLARWVAEPAGINLQVLPSNGSSENVKRLRTEAGVRLALVQSDVYQAFIDEATAGNSTARELIKPLRVVLPLYNEEIYFVTRADSPLNFIQDIKDKRINVGPIGSGTALSATTLYRAMFGTPIADANTSYLSNEDALLKLATDRSIDVAVIVAGQPAKLFADMKTEARQLIKLLRFDEQAAGSQDVLRTYFPTTIRAGSYPNWLTEDIPGVSVKAMLVTYDFRTAGLSSMLKQFSKSLCANFGTLQTSGHPKWQEVSLDLPKLGAGWSYYEPAYQELSVCKGLRAAKGALTSASEPSASCPQSSKVLGLCGKR